MKMAESRFRKERVFEFLKDDELPSHEKMRIVKPLSFIFGCAVFSMSMMMVFFMDYCMDKEVTSKTIRSLSLENKLESHGQFFSLGTEDHAFGLSVTRKEDYFQLSLFFFYGFLFSSTSVAYALSIETGREIASFKPGERVSNAVYSLNSSAGILTVLNTTYSDDGCFLVSSVSNGNNFSKVHQSISELRGKYTDSLFPGYFTKIVGSKKGKLVLRRLAKQQETDNEVV